MNTPVYTIRQYLSTLCDPHALTRTLGEIALCRRADGRPHYSVGNSAVVFRIRRAERVYALRCYFRPMRHLREIYGEQLLEKELYLYTLPDGRGEWVDVVIDDWIDGINFRTAIDCAAQQQDTNRLGDYAARFDRLAAEILADDRAHGDLKPENMLVTADGELHPIDLDATYLPAFAGEVSPELGTAAYQHPARTREDFGDYLDDYPAALISTALHALVLDPTLAQRNPDPDTLLFSPHRIPDDPLYREALTLFERQGLVLPYRIAQTLCAPTPRLFGLAALFAQATRPPIAPPDDCPELFVANGRWGYCTTAEVTIPPLYDEGFDFTEGLAAVRLNRSWYFIDSTGAVRIRCLGADAIKPFRNGLAEVIAGSERYRIDTCGNQI